MAGPDVCKDVARESVSPIDCHIVECGSEDSTVWGSEGGVDIDEFSEASEEGGVKDEDVGEEFEGDEPVGGEDTERIYLEREDEFIRKLVDPKMPTPEELKIHQLNLHRNI